jgi:hypothetical protein
MFWYNKQNPLTVFMDCREVDQICCDGRHIRVSPDVVADFRHMPFPDEHFKVVVFDPPHLIYCGDNSWLAQKYGKLPIVWQPYLAEGFDECWRVLEFGGVLVFKWSETDIPASEIVKVFGRAPLIWHKYAKNNGTHWMLFIKTDAGPDTLQKEV